MKFKSTIVYAVLLAGLGTYYYLHEMRGKGDESARVAEEKKILHFGSDRVKRLSLLRRDEAVICVRKPGNEWFLTRPVETEVDKDAVSRVLDTLQGLEPERVVADSAALASGAARLADFGLEMPRLSIVTEVDSIAAPHGAMGAPGSQAPPSPAVSGGPAPLYPLDVLYFGDENPTKSFVFAKLGQRSEVFTVRLYQFDNLNKKAFDLRQKRVLVFNKDDVRGIELSRAKEDLLVFEKSGEDWFIERPQRLKADQDELKGILNRLDGEKAKEYVDEHPTDLAQYGLGTPSISLTLWIGADRAKKTLTIGSPRNDYFCAKDESRSPVFGIDSAYVASLQRKTLFDLRDKSLAEDFQVDDITKVELVYPDRAVTCLKDTGSVWLVTTPSVARAVAKTWRVRSAISAIQRAKAKEFAAPGPLTQYGLAGPVVRATLYKKAGRYLEFDIGSEKGEGVYAKTDRAPSVYVIDKNIRDDLSPTVDDLIDEPAQTAKKSDGKG